MASPNHKKVGVVKEWVGRIADWILDHTKIVMPLILIVCVLVTVIIALNANERSKLEKEAEIIAANATEAEAVANLTAITIPDIPLEEDKYPEINELITNYYAAVAEGNIEAATAINVDLDDLAKIRIEEMAKYIEYYDTVKVYTKVGLTEGSYVTYVYAEVKCKDVDALMPGLQTYYVVKEEDGNLVIKKNDLDENVYEYIKAVSLQDDVVDLNNKITVEFNDLIAEDKELEEFISYMAGKINEDVGVVLAKNEQPDITAETVKEETGAEAGNSQTADQPSVTTIKTAKATDVVNIRSSDSETADKLDKAQIGQEFTVLEEKGNGWSRIKYNNGDAYIKSQYLEIIDEEEVQAPETPEVQQTAPAESASDVSTDGTVKVKESVRVRGSAGTDGEVLGTVYGGDKLDFIEKMSNGWTKVKYKGKVGYIKSDYVE